MLLSYYVTAIVGFTLGFVVAAAFRNGRRAETDGEQAWLAMVISKFTKKARRHPSPIGAGEQYLVDREELEALEASVRAMNSEEN